MTSGPLKISNFQTLIPGLEQLTVVIRWVADDYTVFEDLVGMHQADKCNANSIVQIIKNVLISLGLDLMHIRGQTYDGASVLQGHHNGVAKQILVLNPKALSTHCLNHNLNLILQEAASVNTLISGTFSVVQSLCNVIRASPKRLSVFKNFQLQCSYSKEVPGNISSIKPLCPTRWTCRTESLASVLHNYNVILETLEEIRNNGGNSEGAKTAPGLIVLMEKFSTVFGLKMCFILFSVTEEMASKLQSKQIHAGTVRTIRDGLLRYLNDLRTDEHFNKLFNDAKLMCETLDIEMPTLPRRRKTAKKINDYLRTTADTDHVWDSPEQYYKQQFYQVIDIMIVQIKERFNQETLNYLISIEDLVISAAMGEEIDISDDLTKKLDGDLNVSKLESELKLLPSFVKEVDPLLKKETSINTIMDIMKKGKLTNVFSELHTLFKLYLTVPLSNATAERSFSALHRIKSYLRSRLTQEHLNHFVVLHAHKYLTDVIDLTYIAKCFVGTNERRQAFFGKM